MSTLSNLKLVTTKKPTHMPAIVVRRHKLSKKYGSKSKWLRVRWMERHLS